MFMRRDQLNDALLVRPAGESQKRAFHIMLLVLAIPSVAAVGGLFLIRLLQPGQCPPGSLYWGGTPLQGRTLGYPWLLPVITWIGYRGWLGKALRDGRLVAGRESRAFRILGNCALALALGTAAFFSVDAAFAQFCVLHDGVTFRPSLLSPVKTYPWTAVRQVNAACGTRSGGGRKDDYDYVLVMNDGRRIDLGYADVPPTDLLQSTRAVFRNLEIAYDSSGVRSFCFGNYRSLLLQRPD